MKVFLGGTLPHGKVDWRDIMIPQLKLDYFNPVVADWDETCFEKETQAHNTSDFLLYVITPFQQGHFSYHELTADSLLKPEKTVVCFLREWEGRVCTDREWRTCERVAERLSPYNKNIFYTLEDVITYLNTQASQE